MFTYTTDQQRALDFPGNVIVSAGAGSGKTRVLVEKYFKLLVDEHPSWPVESVVAITFTRKAASELKSRIVLRVLGELENPELSSDRRARLQQVRNDLGAAPIGTIHTFCARILREFAFDAHLNPDFAIVEGARESTLRSDAAKETVAAATADTGGELYQALLVLLNVMSPTGLQALLAQMLAWRGNYLKPAQRYVEAAVDELFADLHGLHTEYVAGVRAELASEWLAAIRELERKCVPGKLRNLAAATLARWPDDPADEWELCAELLDEFISGALTKTGTCRKVDFRKAEIEEHDPVRELLEDVAERHRKVYLDDLSQEDRDDIELSRHLARLFLHAAEAYNRLRGGGESEDDVQLLDYADLEALAERMIEERPRMARLLRDRYRFLILDEFQDTSEQQWKILRSLCVDESGQALPSRLFVVGDRKQGVYGFREANVRLFSDVQALITSCNEDWMDSRGAVSMTANFRTSRHPLELVNRVFERVLSSVDNEWSVEFEELTLARTGDGGCVEYLFVEPPENADGKPVRLTAEVKRQQEAALVAAHIARAVKNGARPGDIAILVRRRSVFGPYEEALQAHGIPVATQEGLNMFHQPELADALAALNAVVYPHRDMVFVHYLRSPGVGFTDDLLLKISRTPGRSYYEKAVHVHKEGKYRLDGEWLDLTPAEAERLAFALATLRQARKMVGLQPPYAVVRFLFDTMGLRLIARASYRGEQAVANLDKLLDVARGAEFLSYEDFLEYVEGEEQNDRGTGEAADLATVDAVKIMTIHAAKGLEFPMVYLPDLNSGIGGRPRTVDSDGSDWMTLRLPSDARGEMPVFLSEFFKLRSEQQALAEERRVFYVAMTRCKNHLVLCATGGKSAGRNCFYAMVEPEFEQAATEGKLLTPDDFDNDELDPPQQYRSAQDEHVSRKVRLDLALRAAGVLASDG